jgi:hypothetical protein
VNGTGVLLGGWSWRDLATVMPFVGPSAPSDLPLPRLLDRQGWSTLLAGALLLLISFITNYGDDNLLQFANLKTAHQIGMGLHLAALAALFGVDEVFSEGVVELATRQRHRAAHEAAEDRIGRQREAAAREREALEAVAREQRQNRALRAGALFLLDPNPHHRRFLAYTANEMAGASASHL